MKHTEGGLRTTNYPGSKKVAKEDLDDPINVWKMPHKERLSRYVDCVKYHTKLLTKKAKKMEKRVGPRVPFAVSIPLLNLLILLPEYSNAKTMQKPTAMLGIGTNCTTSMK